MEKLIVLFLVCFVGINAEGSCVTCDSSQNVSCAQNPETILSRSCTNITSLCYTEIVDGITKRGCTSDLSQQDFDKCKGNNDNCLICSEAQCNGQVFPLHRLRCLQCKGTINDTCANNNVEPPIVCSLYSATDKCYIRKSTKHNEFIRGCLSSSADHCKNETQCLTCNGYGCNNHHKDSDTIPDATDSSIQIGVKYQILIVSLIVSIYKQF